MNEHDPGAVRQPWLARFYGGRRLADKILRRGRQALGRPDPAPWIMRPRKSSGRSSYVDLLVALDYLSPNSELIEIFQRACDPYGLSLLLVNSKNRDHVAHQLQTGWMRPHLYLDLCSAVEPAFWELLNIASRAGIHTVADPAIQPTWTIKATAQPLLEAAGLPVPPTVIIRRDEPDRDLTSAERACVGERCVIKPSFGVAGRGTVVDIPPTATNIALAREFNRQDDWLIQRLITWPRFDGRQAYVRSFNVLGCRTLMWWAKEKGIDTYSLLSWDDVRKHDLLPIVSLTDRLAELSGMEFFSSEVAILGGPELPPAQRFILIDYLNDQCDMDCQPGEGKLGVPLPFVKWVCERFAQEVFRRKQGAVPDPTRTISLPIA